jgi:rubrerythrin
MNWTYIISGCVVELGLLTLVYNLAARRSDAHNKWLKDQLEAAKSNAPDVLIKTLSERRIAMEGELQRLLQERDYNKVEVKVLQAKIDKTRRIQKELNSVLEEYRTRYEDLKRKIDICPYCGAGLVELKDVYEGDWSGAHRKYQCGYTILDGEMVFYCPSDPNYPKFEEFELTLQPRIVGGGYTIYMTPKIRKHGMIEEKSSFGRTEDEAIQNLKEDYYRNPAILNNDNPAF